MKKLIAVFLAAMMIAVSLPSCGGVSMYSATSFDFFDTVTELVGYTRDSYRFAQVRGEVRKLLSEYFVLFSEAIVNRTDARMLQSCLAEAMSVLEEYPDWKTASMLEPGESVKVASFGRNLAENAPEGVAIGDLLTLQSTSLDRKTLRFRAGDRSLELLLEVAENLWVKPLDEE